jgi:hypothetical protein
MRGNMNMDVASKYKSPLNKKAWLANQITEAGHNKPIYASEPQEQAALISCCDCLCHMFYFCSCTLLACFVKVVPLIVDAL